MAVRANCARAQSIAPVSMVNILLIVFCFLSFFVICLLFSFPFSFFPFPLTGLGNRIFPFSFFPFPLIGLGNRIFHFSFFPFPFSLNWRQPFLPFYLFTFLPLKASLHQFVRHQSCLVAVFRVLFKEVGEEEKFQDSEDNNEFYYYHRPKRSPHSHLCEAVPVKPICLFKKVDHKLNEKCRQL